MINLKKIKEYDRVFLSILALASCLLLFRIGYRTLWMDETAVLLYLHASPVHFIIEYFKFPDNHPPLYYLLVVITLHILPWSEFAVRLVSVLAGLGIVTFVFIYTKHLLGKTYAYNAAFFTALSSYFVLISQTARYHSLAALLTFVVFYLTHQLVTTGYDRRYYRLFIVLYALVAWTDYPHFFYSITLTNATFFYYRLRRKTVFPIKKWFAAQMVVALTALPLVWLIYHRIVYQGDNGWGMSNLLGNSSSHILVGILFHIYSFFFGENILPWNNGALAGGGIVLVGGLAGLFLGIKQKFFPPMYIYSVVLFFSLIILNTLFFNIANPRYNFIVLPKYGFVAYPFFIITLIGALRVLPLRWRQACFIAWFGVAVFGLYNFYSTSNYLNGSYFNTFRSMEYTRDNSREGEYVAITGNLNQGVYRFYKEKYFYKLEAVLPEQFNTLPAHARLWFFSTGSDDLFTTHSTDASVPAGYTIVKQYDSVPLDPTLKKLKEKILHRQSYTYKYSVFLLEKNK